MKVAAVKPTIKFQDLDKLDIRVGTIEEVVDIENSDKLVKLIVNFGDHKRNIVVGLKKERENPKEIEGKQALFVVNLESKEMMGVKSEGTLFDASTLLSINPEPAERVDIGYSDGIIPVLAVPEKKVPDGTKAG